MVVTTALLTFRPWVAVTHSNKSVDFYCTTQRHILGDTTLQKNYSSSGEVRMFKLHVLSIQATPQPQDVAPKCHWHVTEETNETLHSTGGTTDNATFIVSTHLRIIIPHVNQCSPFEDSLDFLRIHCNCHYNCYEALILGPTWITSPGFLPVRRCE